MRRIAVIALVLGLPGAAWASWSSVGTLGTGTSTSGGTTVAVTTSAALESGNVGLCVIAKDESGSGTTDGTGNAQFTSVADDAGNNWIEAYEWCNMQTSTAANGACVAVYYTKATSTLNSGAAITATITSVNAKAITCWEFSATSSPLAVAETAGENGLANDGADPGSMTLASGVNAEHLFIRATACETNTTTYTADTDYNALSNATAVIAAATSMAVRGEYRIATESTSAASDPTLAAADCASAMVAFDESVAPARNRFLIVQ